MKTSHHWHVGIASQGGRDGFASIEHEHRINEGRPHVHRDPQGNVYTGPGLRSEPRPEQLRDALVRPVPSRA